MNKGQTVTIRGLKKALGHTNHLYAPTMGVVKQLPKTKKGEMRKFEVLVDEFPSSGEFNAMLGNHFKTSLNDLLDGAFIEIEQLEEEISDWYENLGENLQCSSKGEELEECSSCLQNIERVEIDDERIGEIQISYVPTHSEHINSRAERLNEACDALTTVKEYLEELIEEESTEELASLLTADEKETIQGEYIDLLENATDEISGVEFPSMY